MRTKQPPPCPNCGEEIFSEVPDSIWVVCLEISECPHCGNKYQLESDEIFDGETDMVYFYWVAIKATKESER